MNAMPSLLHQIVTRVVVEPVRTGSLRFRDWTPQLVAIGIVAALSALASIVLIGMGGWLRATQPLSEHADVSLPVVAFAPMVIIACVTLTFLLAGLVQASWPFRIAAVLLAVSAFATVSFIAFGWRDYPRSVPVMAAVVAFIVLALWRPKGATWWLPSVVLLIVTTGFVLPLALTPDQEIEFIVLGLFTTMLAAAAVAPMIVVALAGVEVALSTVVWVADLGGERLSGTVARVVAGASALAAAAFLVFRLVSDPGADIRLLGGSALVTVGLLAAMIAWHRVTHDMEAVDVAHLPDAARTLLWAVAAIVGIGFFVSITIDNINSAFAAWTWGDPNPLVQRFSSYWAFIMRGLGALVAVGFAIRAWLRRQRRVFVVAIMLSTIMAVAAGTSNGWWARWWDQAGVAVAMIGFTTVLIGAWAIGRRFTRERATQSLAMVGLSLTVALPDLVGDPVAALLGTAGAGAILFGLVWNMLTSADFANHDTPGFPRQARVLLLFGLALITLLQFALSSVVQAGALATVVTGATNIGTVQFGTALLIAAWALLALDSLFPVRSAAPPPAMVDPAGPGCGFGNLAAASRYPDRREVRPPGEGSSAVG